MYPMATLALVRGMDDERRRQARPPRRVEDDLPDVSRPPARSWAEVLRFPRFEPAKG
ncbi:MAG TPA: hypothetical protein VIH24_07690 [Candidatus Limnocylindria bacterium]|jgi:hypothetical protein